jgi:hypothetical protein
MKHLKTTFCLVFVLLQAGYVNPVKTTDYSEPPAKSLNCIESTLDVKIGILDPFLSAKIPPSGYDILNNKQTGTAFVTIRSNKQGYDVYVDSMFGETEGVNEPRDGRITIRVAGNLNHNIKIVKGDYSNDKNIFCERDGSYNIDL